MLVALGAGALSLWGVGPSSALRQNALDFLHIKALGAPATLLLMVAQARLLLSDAAADPRHHNVAPQGAAQALLNSFCRFRLPLQLPGSVPHLRMPKAPPAPSHMEAAVCSHLHCERGTVAGALQWLHVAM